MKTPAWMCTTASVSRGSWWGLLLALSLAAVAADPEGAVVLKPKWKPGQRQVTRISMSQDQEIAGAGLPGPMKQVVTQVQDIALNVLKEHPGGGHELEISYARMRMETKMGDMVALKFDSDAKESDDAGNPAAPIFRAMVGMKFRLITDAQGQVARVEGMKEVREKLAASVPPMFAGMLEGLLNEDNVKQMGAVPQGLPDKPVKVGDTWPVKLEVALGPLGRLDVAMTMTFKGWETLGGRRCARLDHTGTLTGRSEPSTNMVTLTSLSGETQGQSWFDAEAGVMRESRTVQKMKMQMKAVGQEMSSQMTQNLTNQLVELSDK